MGALPGFDIPTRMARGPDDTLWVTDAGRGSVFGLDRDLRIIREISELDRPLGIAVDSAGLVYVGDQGSGTVRSYDPQGQTLGALAKGLRQPNDLAFDFQSRLYVVDSLAAAVLVYSPEGSLLRRIAPDPGQPGALAFPVALAIGGGRGSHELFVADQRHELVQVFDLDGRFLRSFGGRPTSPADRDGRFLRIQAIDLDPAGRLLALDSFTHQVQLLETQGGTPLLALGGFGHGPGQLNVPLDVLALDKGLVAVTSAGNRRIELLTLYPPDPVSDLGP